MKNENEIREAFEKEVNVYQMLEYIESSDRYDLKKTSSVNEGSMRMTCDINNDYLIFKKTWIIATESANIKLDQRDQIIKTLYDRLKNIYSENIKEPFMIKAKALLDG